MQRQGLYRSRTDKVFGGVAGGIARSLNADPAIVRVIFAILIIFGGGGILLYLILWIAIPEEPFGYFQAGTPSGEVNPEQEGEQTIGQQTTPVYYPPRKNNGALIAGLILIAVGAIFLIDRFLPDIHIRFRDFWPIVIVIAGLALIFTSFSGIKKNQNP
jgi:phage shock protein PspC (stress-responsive transcriptional regulator)